MNMRRLLVIAPLVLVSGCTVSERVERIPAREPVSVESMVADLAAGAPEAQVCAEIQAHGVLRSPSPDDVIALKRAGASDALVIAVLRAPVTTPSPARRIVHRSYDLDWDLMGEILGGTLRVTAEVALRCCTAIFRCR
jgi:hypothetical protein